MRFLAIAIILVSSLQGAIDPKIERKPVHEAFVARTGTPLPIEIIPNGPPTSKIEMPPVKPESDLIWIPGYWHWDRQTKTFSWISGVWRRPPPLTSWVPGVWKQANEGWYWVAGLWHANPSQALLASEIPPAIPEENVETGDEKSFWSPGYWSYNRYEKNYRWLEGSWQPFDPDWVLISARWISRSEGILFQPSYWDYPINKRGVAYDLSGKKDYTPVTTETLINRIYSSYPDYLSVFWHHWHYNPEYWQGCWCLPSWWTASNWWTLNPNHQWALWWWWSHPEYPHPYWMDSSLADSLPPADSQLVTYIKSDMAPIFITAKGVPSAYDWLQAIKRVTGKDTPLLPSASWDKTAEMAGSSLPPSGSVLKASGKAPLSYNFRKPVFQDYVQPVGQSYIPPKPIIQKVEVKKAKIYKVENVVDPKPQQFIIPKLPVDQQ